MKSFLNKRLEIRNIKSLLHAIHEKFPEHLVAETRALLLTEPEFVRLHLSLFYPFSFMQLEEYRSKLIWGSIKYSTFVWNISSEPLQFAEIGLSFNKNIFVLYSEEEFLRLKGEEQYINKLKMTLPLGLAGELEDRYATRCCGYTKSAMQVDFCGELHADSIVDAWELYYYEKEIEGIKTLKELLHTFGPLAAYCKNLYDEFLIGYFNEKRLAEIMEQL